MPVISMVSPKGGVGKTTTALALAGAFADAGHSVILLDADPNQPISSWAELGDVPDGIDVMGGVIEENISEFIESASAQATFVIVDLEGTANSIVTFALMQSDFAVIPVQGSQLDAIEAVKAMNLIKRTERAAKVTIPHGVLLTRTSAAIRGGSLRQILADFEAVNLPMFETQMIDREAFRAMFSFGATIFQLSPSDVSGVDKAQENAIAVAEELVDRLKGPKKARKSRKKRAA